MISLGQASMSLRQDLFLISQELESGLKPLSGLTRRNGSTGRVRSSRVISLSNLQLPQRLNH